MNRRMLLMVCLLLIAAGTPAAGHWTTNPYAFQYDMTAYIRLTPVANQKHELAAFCGDECRGVGKWIKAADGTWIIQMRIRSNQADGETIRFMDYDPLADKELLVEGSVDFVSQSVAGLPGEPMELRIVDLLLGDVNGDGNINVTDVGMVIDHILEHTPSGFIVTAADINGDGDINVTDVGLIIDIILSDNSAREAMREDILHCLHADSGVKATGEDLWKAFLECLGDTTYGKANQLYSHWQTKQFRGVALLKIE